jgi:hypothetical protein
LRLACHVFRKFNPREKSGFFSLRVSIFLGCLLLLTARVPAQIVINEIQYHPASNNDLEEWIELHNTSDTAVNLDHWKFTHGVDFRFPAIEIPADGYLVVAADMATFSAQHPSVPNAIGNWKGHLSDKDERLTLEDASGVERETVHYYDEGDWAQRQRGPLDHNHRGWIWSDAHDSGGSSLELINPLISNKYGQNWSASVPAGGTPGQVNSVYAAGNSAPLIHAVQHAPAIPNSAQATTVTARVLDENPAGLVVNLYYRTSDAASFTVLPMFDNSAHADGVTSGALYAVQIPPHASGTVVEFYVRAVDAELAARTWPAPASVDGVLKQSTNALYQVLNTPVPATPQNYPIYFFVMTETERAELAYIGSHSSDADSYAMMNCTFISYDENGWQVRYLTGNRNRGHGSRSNPPNNYHINFVNSDPWEGLYVLNLNAKYPFSQIVGHNLFHKAGMPASNVKPVWIRVNGQDLATNECLMYGVYVQVEALTPQYTENQFPDDPDGNIYKCMRNSDPSAELLYLGENPDAYRTNYTKETNAEKDDWTDLINLTKVLDSTQTPDSEFPAAMQSHFNVDQWARHIALQNLLANGETTLANGDGDDYALYRGFLDTRFFLLPYDLDTLMGQGENPIGKVDDGIFRFEDLPSIRRFLDYPPFVRRYYWHLNDLANTLLKKENLDPYLSSLIGTLVPAAKLSEIETFMDARVQFVKDLIPTTFTLAAYLPRKGGYYRTTAPVAPLYGTANATQTASLFANGVKADWTPRDGKWGVGKLLGYNYNKTLIAKKSVWKYLDNGSDQGTAWYGTTFSDTTWKSGAGELGYGDNNQETTVVSYGPDANNKYITTYFRRHFTVDDVSSVTLVNVNLRCDDGAVVYINNQEAFRYNMPMTGTIGYKTTAIESLGEPEENTFYLHAIKASLLKTGDNVIAVEVHQQTHDSSDISFDLEMTVSGGTPITQGGYPLTPGLNHITINTYETEDGSGPVLYSEAVDVWYDVPSTPLSGTLTDTTTTLTADKSPYHVTGDLIVPVGKTLVVDAGVTLFFDAGTGVQVYGRIVGNGTENSRIHFAALPGSAEWNGILISNTLEKNKLSFTDIAAAGGADHALYVDHSTLDLDHVTWEKMTANCLYADTSSLTVSDCVTPAGLTAEAVEGHGILPGGRMVFQRCVFGANAIDKDVFRFFSTQRPNAIPEIYACRFLGGGGYGCALYGADAHLEDCVFENFHQASPTQTDSANAVVGGADNGTGSELTVVRCVFRNNEQDLLVKDGESFLTAENNLFLGSEMSSIHFDELNRANTTPGKGADLTNNIFTQLKGTVLGDPSSISPEPDPIITINHCILPAQYHSLGSGNLDADPLLADADNGDYSLLPGSPALGNGKYGIDMGPNVPQWISILSKPAAVTTETEAAFTVWGPGLTHFKYSLDNGDFSSEIPRSQNTFQLPNLSRGIHTLRVLGKNSAAAWQPFEAATSYTWTVNPSSPVGAVAVSELMYNPAPPTTAEIQAGVTDNNDFEFIELVNYSDGPVDLTGAYFNGVVYTFPATSLQPDARLVIARNPQAFAVRYGAAIPVLGPYTGKLSNSGEKIGLYTKTGEAVCEFEYATDHYWPAAADGAGHSLVARPAAFDRIAEGSFNYPGNWRASTFLNGSPGVADPEPAPSVVLNEVAAHTHYHDPMSGYNSNDWIELYNPTGQSVTLQDWYLSDDASDLRKWAIPAGTSLNAGAFQVFDEFHNFHNPLTSGFGLDEAGEKLFLSHLPAGAPGQVVDALNFQGQESGVTFSRTPDGTPYWSPTAPTTGTVNALPVSDAVLAEVLYHPSNDTTQSEYVRISNPTDHAIPFWNAAGTWRLTGGVELTFPGDFTLPAGGSCLLVSFNPTDVPARQAFLSTFGLTTLTLPVLGPWTGSLSNVGEALRLERPQLSDVVGEPVNWVTVDDLYYFQSTPFDPAADGQGASLHRQTPNRPGLDPASWKADVPSPDGKTSTPFVYYTLTTAAQNGTVQVHPDLTQYASGTVVTLEAVPVSQGYTFNGWTGNLDPAQKMSNPLKLTMDRSRQVQAVFVQSAQPAGSAVWMIR